jgi:hypothetical protein
VRARQLGSLIALASLAVTMGFMIYATQPWDGRGSELVPSSAGPLALLFVWAASPYIGALLVVPRIRNYNATERVELVLLALACLAGPVMVVAAAAGMGGAQAGLGFLFLPFLQWFALAAIAAVFAVVRRRRAV